VSDVEVPRNGRREALLVALMAVAVGVTSFLHQLHLYENLYTSGRDLTYFTQSAWNATHGAGLTVTVGVRGAHLFGEHLYVTHWVSVALHALHPDASTFFLISSLAAGLLPVATYRLARAVAVSTRGSLLLALLVAVHPSLHGGVAGLNSFGPHPDVQFAVPFLFANEAWLRGRRVTFVLLFILTLLTLEQAGIAWCGVGLAWFLAGRRRAGVTVAFVGAAWFLLAGLVIIPAFAEGHGTWYAQVAKASGPMGDTLRAAAACLLFHVVALAGLPLLSRASIAVLPYVVVYGMGHHGGYELPLNPLSWHSIDIMAVLLVAVAPSLARIEKRFAGKQAAMLVVVVACLAAAGLSAFTVSRDVYGRCSAPLAPARRAEIQRLQSVIPPTGSLAATAYLAPHFSNRADIRIFPTVEDADWILLDFAPPWRSSPEEQELFESAVARLASAGTHEIVSRQEGFLLARRAP